MSFFGLYYISLRTLSPEEIPPQFLADPSITLQFRVQVAHIVGIPIFPFDKGWFLYKDGQSYNLTDHVSAQTKQMFGEPRMPWFVFALPLLLLVGSTIYESYNILSDRKHKYEHAQRVEKKQTGLPE